ncbi:MAG: hypothetical protein J0M26_11015 [Planctomycetes bacterium]|nr:hypothetical protein [Planctomycetota bacterium]
MRTIHDERLEPNPGFLTTALAWVAVIAVPTIDFVQGFLNVPPHQRFVTNSLKETWDRGWLFFGVVGAIALFFGLLGWAFATRVAVDGQGIRLSSLFGGDRWLFMWADVRSWRVESYEEASYGSDGCGGIATLTRFVVELESRAIPLVVKDTWKTSILTELKTTLPLLRSQELQQTNPATER